ncbi:MAG TPA: hypothetical protein VFU17_01450 [Candidatus Limnocylindrales bacterium]|nr:hypothetical protein [Candidatus Limnocylindrales bacterium]
MDRTRRHLRSLLVATGLLGLTAGLAVGHELPTAADEGLGTAAEAAGKTVPVRPDALAAPVVKGTEGAENSAPAAGERKATHGLSVSEAANAETPDGFDNHGEYVSSVARGDAGKPEASAGGQDKAAAAPGRTKATEAKNKGKGGEEPAE